MNPLPRELEPARKTGAIPCEKNCVYESTLPHHGVPGTTFRTSETIIPFNQPHKQPRYLIYVHLENKKMFKSGTFRMRGPWFETHLFYIFFMFKNLLKFPIV